MAWYLAKIVNGFADGPLATGRHVYINRTILNRVRVVGQHDNTAILALDAARKHLRIERRNGEPIRVKDQGIRWDRLRAGRAFRDLRRGMAA